MERKRIKIQVHQRIHYAHSQEKDTFHLETEGDLLVLRTYSRLTYYDQDGVEITIKWYPQAKPGTPYVEIHQPHHQLVFNPLRPTFSRYQTPQGEWPLTVLTQDVKGMAPAPSSLSVDYQIKQGDHLLGDYYFQLKFSD